MESWSLHGHKRKGLSGFATILVHPTILTAPQKKQSQITLEVRNRNHQSLRPQDGQSGKLVAGAQSNQAIRLDENDTTHWAYHAWSQDLGRPNQARELVVEVISMNPDKIALQSELDEFRV